MNNKGFTLVELIYSLFATIITIAFFGGCAYVGYLVIRALQKYIGA